MERAVAIIRSSAAKSLPAKAHLLCLAIGPRVRIRLGVAKGTPELDPRAAREVLPKRQLKEPLVAVGGFLDLRARRLRGLDDVLVLLGARIPPPLLVGRGRYQFGKPAKNDGWHRVFERHRVPLHET